MGETLKTDPIRILAFLGNYRLLGQERGNIEAYSALQKAGYEVTVVIRSNHIEHSIRAELIRRKIPFIEIVHRHDLIQSNGFFRFFYAAIEYVYGNIQLAMALPKLRPNYFMTGNLIWIGAFLVPILVSGKKIVFRSGDKIPRHNFVYRLIWRLALPRIKHFVCISKFIKDHLTERGADPSRMSVIYNFPTTRRAETAPTFEKGDSFIVTYLGQINRPKGVESLINVLAKNKQRWPKLKLLIVGEYKDTTAGTDAQQLFDLAKHLKLDEQVVFTGFVEDIYGLLRATDVHVCPSYYEEPLGNVVMEAKQAGVPSIVFPSGGLPEMIDDHRDGLICTEKSEAALEQAISNYYDNPSLARSHGQNAIASLERLGCQSFVERWAQVFAHEPDAPEHEHATLGTP